jgi:hypothetical protein
MISAKRTHNPTMTRVPVSLLPSVLSIALFTLSPRLALSDSPPHSPPHPAHITPYHPPRTLTHTFPLQTVSTRYAPHLASCLGLSGSTRRGATRQAATKARLGHSDRSSPSPYYDGSQNGDSDGESTAGKKSKSEWIWGGTSRSRAFGRGEGRWTLEVY